MSESKKMIDKNARVASPFAGMLRVVLFNWPVYVFAAACASGSIGAALLFPPSLMRYLLLAAAALGLWQALASLVASHWVYDRSSFRGGLWLDLFKPPDGASIVSVHSGYDEIGANLQKRFAGLKIATVDLFPALGRREFSIIMAKTAYPPSSRPICTTINNWPITERSVDLVLIAFAAHELRQAGQKEMLFKQAAGVLKSKGQIVLVEHLRDWPNFLAFGPGFMHFASGNEWRRCIAVAGLKIVRHYKITPFVEVFVLCL